VTESSHAVFLSYASQDAEAAQRICEALRAAGIEVWFDQSELRGGDVWDRQIRKQIHDCALFIPIISATTQGRLEGYFRREWRMAVDRTHDMADAKPFLVPVVIDSTKDQDAEVPDYFRAVHWSRLPGGDTPPSFVERVSRLLSPEAAHQTAEARSLAAASQTAAAPRQPAPGPPETRQMQRVLLVIAAVAIIGVGYFALDKLWLRKRSAVGAQASVSAGQTGAPVQSAIPEKSIAVLPFVDMSEKHDEEYFSDGLSEELIDLLAKVPDLRVPARTSSFFFKGKSEDIAAIAQKLRVANVLEGSVRKAANTVRVTAQLIRADNGYHLWSETYDRDLKDVFKVQDEIAGAVVSALKLKLAPGQEVYSSHRTSIPEAYNQYLLGRQFFERFNSDGFRRAVNAYRKAVELDPHYAAAYAELALAQFFASNNTDTTEHQRALESADKAVQLAPDEADGYSARELVRLWVSWDWAGAQADSDMALALAPGDSRVQRHTAVLMRALGRLPEAIAAARKATEFDPLSSTAWMVLSDSLTVNRQFAAAHEAIRRALEIQPESTSALDSLGTLQLLEGKALEALATFRQKKDEGGVAMAEHTLGHANESQQALGQLIAKHAQDAPADIAHVYAWLGERDQAFDWLDRAYRQHDTNLAEIKADLLLNSLLGDPRYKALLRKMNLPE
jgi:TolB-like protein/Tfp pilus assembly protein PilF